MKHKNKKWNRKGASPLIATVILIGLVIALSISIFTFTRTNLADIQKITEKQITSAELIDFEIKGVIATNNDIRLLVENRDDRQISKLDISVITSKDRRVIRSSGIEPFTTKWVEVNITLKENVTSVEVTPLTTKEDVNYVHQLSAISTTNVENKIISFEDTDQDNCIDNIDFNITEYCPVATCSLDLRSGCSNKCEPIYCESDKICDAGICKPKVIEKFGRAPYKGKVINEFTEAYTEGELNTYVIHKRKQFHKLSDEWYTIDGLVELVSDGNNFVINYLDTTLTLKSFVIKNNVKEHLDNLDEIKRSKLSNRNIIDKKERIIEFGNEISNYGIDKFGYDIVNTKNANVRVLNNKLIINDLIEINFNDLKIKGYLVNIKNNEVTIGNLIPGINNLDPSLKFYSNTKDGSITGPVGGTGNGNSVSSGLASDKTGYGGVSIPEEEYRSFLNFNTSALTTKANITLVKLFFRVQTHINNNLLDQPCNIGGWNYEVRNGTFISTSLDITDYSKGIVNKFISIPAAGSYTLVLTNNSINQTGETDLAFKAAFAHNTDCDEFNNIFLSESADVTNDPYLNISFILSGGCSGDQPPTNGDWIVNQTTICVNTSIILNHNLTVRDKGNLSLRNVKLTFNNNYRKNITIYKGGIFEVLDSDENNNTIDDRSMLNLSINSNPALGQDNNNTILLSMNGSTLIFKNSYFEDFGKNLDVDNDYAFDIYGESYIVNNTFLDSSSIILRNNKLVFAENNIKNTMTNMYALSLLELSGLTIRKSYFDMQIADSKGINIYNSSDVTLAENNLLLNVNGAAIHVNISKNITINNSVIRNTNTVLNQPIIWFVYVNYSNINNNNLSGRSTIILLQNSSYNLISNINATSSVVNSIFLIDSQNNYIYKNYIDTKMEPDFNGSGISLINSLNNTINDNYIEFDGYGVKLENSNFSNIINLRTFSNSTVATTINMIFSSDNKVVDSKFLNVVNGSDLYGDTSFNNYFINVSYNKFGSALVNSANVVVQWYLDVNVTYANGTNAIGTNVTIHNTTGIYYFSDIVGVNGFVARKNVTEYVETSLGGGIETYYTNYTINANTSVKLIKNFSSVFNITSNMQYNITLNKVLCSGTNPPSGNGEWIITTPTICTSVAIFMNGNITILSGGNLSLRNVNLTFSNTDYRKNITIYSGGILEVLDLDNNNNTIDDRSILNSSIKTSPSTLISNINNTFLNALVGSTIIIKNSLIESFGNETIFPYIGFTLNGTSYIANNSFENSAGFIIYNNSLTFSGNIIRNTTTTSRALSLINIGNATLEDNHFISTQEKIIQIFSNNTRNLTISGSSFFTNSSDSDEIMIESTDSKDLTVINNIFTQNSTATTFSYIILFTRVNESNFSYNKIYRIRDSHISFKNSNRNYISNNTFIGGTIGNPLLNPYLQLFPSSNNNTIEKNFFNTTNQIFVLNSVFNTFIDNTIYSNGTGTGLYLSEANSTVIKNMRLYFYAVGANGTRVRASNISIIDSVLNSTKGLDFKFIDGSSVNLYNVSFNQSNYDIPVTGNLLINNWYLDVNVTYSNGTNATNANVTVYNTFGNYIFSELVPSTSSFIIRKNITEWKDATTTKAKNYSTNYTITVNTSIGAVFNYLGVFNITSNLQFNISLMAAGPCLTGTNPPAENGEWNITDTTLCENVKIIMNANVSVRPFGNLTLRNVTLIFNNKLANLIYGIKVANDGNLTITDLDDTSTTTNDASNITVMFPASLTNRTFIYVYPGSKFIIKNSYLSGIAFNGFNIYTPSIITNVTYFLSHALVVYPSANFTNITSNFFGGSQSGTINLSTNTTYSDNAVYNITIAYNNFSAPTFKFIILHDIKSYGVKIMHNKFFGPQGSGEQIDEITNSSIDLFVYNNSFINIGSAGDKSSGLLWYRRGNNRYNFNPNHVFVDNIFNTTGEGIVTIRFDRDSNTTIFWINNSFKYSDVSFEREISGGLIVQWYADINITYSNGSVASNVNVTLYNATGKFFHSFLSEADGITRINIIERFINGLNYSSLYNNYTIDANTSLATSNFTGKLNLTKLNPESADTPMLMYNITLKIVPLPPNITKVEITNDGTLRNCNSTSGCYINPVIHSNVTNLNVSVTTIDLDGNCATGIYQAFIHFCLINFNDPGICDSTKSNFTFELDKILVNSTLPGMKECNFTFNSLKGPAGTMPFFITPNQYKFNVDINEENISLENDPEENGRWIYNSLMAVGYVNSTNDLVDVVKLGGNNPIINQWSYGTDKYNLSNWGNVPLVIRWNVTDPTNIVDSSKFWNLSLYPNRFQIDDDNSTSFIDDSLSPLNLSYLQRRFIYSSGLTLCNSYSCNNENATLPTYFHINPPSLTAGVYNTIITYVITKFDPSIENNIFVLENQANDVDFAILNDNNGMFVMAWCDNTDKRTYFSVRYTNGSTYLGKTPLNITEPIGGDACRISVAALNETSFVITYINWTAASRWGVVGKTIGNLNLFDQQILDLNVNVFSDTSVCALNSTSYVAALLDDSQNDATFMLLDLARNFTPQIDADIFVNPDIFTQNQDTIECAAISNNNWILTYYDKSPERISFNMSDATGAILNGYSVSSSTQSGAATVAALSDSNFVIAYCDNTDGDVSFRTYTNNGANLSGVIDVNTTIGNCNSGNGTHVDISALNKSDGSFVIAYNSNLHNITYIAVYNSSGFALLNSTPIEISDPLEMKALAVEGFDAVFNKSLCKKQLQPVFLLAYNNANDALWVTYYSNGSIWNGIC